RSDIADDLDAGTAKGGQPLVADGPGELHYVKPPGRRAAMSRGDGHIGLAQVRGDTAVGRAWIGGVEHETVERDQVEVILNRAAKRLDSRTAAHRLLIDEEQPEASVVDLVTYRILEAKGVIGLLLPRIEDDLVQQVVTDVGVWKIVRCYRL